MKSLLTLLTGLLVASSIQALTDTTYVIQHHSSSRDTNEMVIDEYDSECLLIRRVTFNKDCQSPSFDGWCYNQEFTYAYDANDSLSFGTEVNFIDPYSGMGGFDSVYVTELNYDGSGRLTTRTRYQFTNNQREASQKEEYTITQDKLTNYKLYRADQGQFYLSTDRTYTWTQNMLTEDLERYLTTGGTESFVLKHQYFHALPAGHDSVSILQKDLNTGIFSFEGYNLTGADAGNGMLMDLSYGYDRLVSRMDTFSVVLYREENNRRVYQQQRQRFGGNPWDQTESHWHYSNGRLDSTSFALNYNSGTQTYGSTHKYTYDYAQGSLISRHVYSYGGPNLLSHNEFEMSVCNNLTLELEEPGTVSSIRLFPNPSQGQVHLSSPDELILSVDVYALSGQKQEVEVIGNDDHLQTLNLETLPKGMYLIHFQTEASTRTERIVLR